MTQPRRYAVVKIDSTNAVQFRSPTSRAIGIAHIANTEKTSYLGELTEDASVIWCDSEGDANAVIEYLTLNFPRNSYAMMNTLSVVYIPNTPAVRARFSDEGLLPV